MTSAIQLYIQNDLKRELKIKAATDGVSISEVARHYLVNWKLGLSGYVNLEDRNNLPEAPGIYFVISNGKVEYIGRSVNLKARLASHHRKVDFEKLITPVVHWIHIDDKERLMETEELFIEIIEPSLNNSKVDYGNSFATKSFRIEKELWDQIKDKAAITGLSVSFILRTLFEMWLNDEIKIEIKA